MLEIDTIYLLERKGQALPIEIERGYHERINSRNYKRIWFTRSSCYSFTQLAAKYASKVTIAANGKTADAKSILTVLTLGATKGTSVTLTADGADEDDALAALSEFLTTNHD